MVDPIRDKVAIVGVGVSRQGQLPEMEPYGIAAVREGIPPSAIVIGVAKANMKAPVT